MKFIHRYQDLDPRLYHHQMPKPLENPRLGHLNLDLIKNLGLDQTLSWQQIIAGNLEDLQKIDDQLNPLAMVYAGHQFGHWAGRLGDGRGLLIAEILNGKDVTELHLKGSGRTPYSRQGDGRAMIGSTIREYLGGHALNHLGIKSSNALGFVVSDTPIQRKHIERAAMLLRTSDCHVRLGHLEYVALYMPDYFAKFVDQLILFYYPQLHKSQNGSTDLIGFLQAICENTATMIAHWQLIGFSHGVMNTDNLNLTGSTLDFGPFGFMEYFNPTWINNQSDHSGRYCYQNQPAIGYWNLQTCLRHFHQLSVGDDKLHDLLDHYERTFLKIYHQGLLKKLGLSPLNCNSDDCTNLAYLFLEILQKTKSDYTNGFRMLLALVCQNDPQYQYEKSLLQQFEAGIGCYQNQWTQWKNSYLYQISLSDSSQAGNLLRSQNPVYILRNHMAQQAIDQAIEDDFSEVERLFLLLKNPYQFQENSQTQDRQPPKNGEEIVVSCMS